MIITINKELKPVPLNKWAPNITDFQYKKQTIHNNGFNNHSNYLGYLSLCWSRHLGAVFSPDILWYTILCEYAQLVKDTPEEFRFDFTDRKEDEGKETLIVPGGEIPTVQTVDRLVGALLDKKPALSKNIMEFSTSVPMSMTAQRLALLDAASPFYNYCMYCCGIPYVDVRGGRDDYVKIGERLAELIRHTMLAGSSVAAIYLNKCLNAIATISRNLKSAEFWSNIFRYEHCGSGSQVEAHGWFADLFYNKRPSVAYISNFNSHVSTIEIYHLSTKINYLVYGGLTTSSLMDDLLEPSFNYHVKEWK